MWMQQVTELILSLLGVLILNITNSQGLEHGLVSISETITSWAMLIYFSEDGERLEAIDRFFRLMHPNCLATSNDVLSGSWPSAWVLLERNKWGWTLLRPRQYQIVLGVLSNAIPGGIHGSQRVTQTLLKKNLTLNPRQEIFDCLVLTLVLVPTKVDSTTKNMNANGV